MTNQTGIATHPMVEARNIQKSFGTVEVLKGIDMVVDRGEVVCLIGPSGSGKSTFLRLLLAQEQPTRGSIRIAGAEPACEPGPDRGVVFQRYSVFPHMTVRDNIVAGARRHQRSPDRVL